MERTLPQSTEMLATASPLQIDLARRIIEKLRDSGAEAGTRVGAPELAREFGVSRTPISAALDLLVALGALRRSAKRGVELACDAQELDPRDFLQASPIEDIYRRMMSDRASGLLDQENSEAELLARYAVSRGVIRKLLMRFAAEGLIHRLPGHGWRFADSLVGDEAYRESYEFRMAVECAALRSPYFRADQKQLGPIRRAHERLLADQDRTTGSDEWFRVNAAFHENLAACSGNRFLTEAVRQQNNLRRMHESASYEDLPAARINQSCREHLAILDAVDSGNLDWAEALLRQHLREASSFRSDR